MHHKREEGQGTVRIEFYFSYNQAKNIVEADNQKQKFVAQTKLENSTGVWLRKHKMFLKNVGFNIFTSAVIGSSWLAKFCIAST